MDESHPVSQQSSKPWHQGHWVGTSSSPPHFPVVDTTRSPYSALRPVSVAAVQLQDAFWSPRLALNREQTLPSQRRRCEETGRLDNFRRVSGKTQAPFQGIYFNDSDVYKWAEAAAFALAAHPDPKLEADLDAVIAEIAAAQDTDGYLNTYFSLERKSERFTNLRDKHEIYCAGHLLQAAVAHHRATGKTIFLDVACRLADCLDATFGPGKRPGACGHEEAEMALVELYRETGEARYLHLARFMVEQRGQKPGLFDNSAYVQDHLPFTEQRDLVGHAVRHLYLACGAADIVAETGDAAYRETLDALWQSLTARRMYATGGAGSRYEGEAFGEDYELPNDRAYTETCAAIASVMWNWRMLLLTGESKYADLMELTLYNAVLCGLSLDGTRYFYQNPLADRGKHRRQEWFGCACCPPNIARMLASLPGYFYSVTDSAVWTHLYATGTATLTMPNGGEVSLTQTTLYPWDGIIHFTIHTNSANAEFLNLRVPAWATGARLAVNGTERAVEPGTYAQIPMPSLGATGHLTLPMPVERVVSHPHVLSNWGRVAIKRGPLIYCIEQTDHPDADVWDILLPDDAIFTPEHHPNLLGGVNLLRGSALALDSANSVLYSPPKSANLRPVPLTAIPYYAWANRTPGPMQVWIPTMPRQFTSLGNER